MKTARRVTISIAALLLLGISVLSLRTPPSLPLNAVIVAARVDASVRANGSNAVAAARREQLQRLFEKGDITFPMLVQWLDYNPPSIPDSVLPVIRRQPSRGIWNWYVSSAVDPKLVRQTAAVWVFAQLGTNAATAVPLFRDMERKGEINTSAAMAVAYATGTRPANLTSIIERIEMSWIQTDFPAVLPTD